MTTVVTSSNRSYHMCRNSAVISVEGRSDSGYFGKAPRPSRVMYTFAVIFRISRPPSLRTLAVDVRASRHRSIRI
jgi:hypothetical protein